MLNVVTSTPEYGVITLTLVGMISMRIFDKLAERLGVSTPSAITTLQEYLDDKVEGLKALPTTMGGSTRFLFVPLIEHNSNLPFATDPEVIQEVLAKYPEIKAPDVSSEKELFQYVVPDFTTIH